MDFKNIANKSIEELIDIRNDIDNEIAARQQEAIEQAYEILKNAFPKGLYVGHYNYDWNDYQFDISDDGRLCLD